jgi:hypothetical protein
MPYLTYSSSRHFNSFLQNLLSVFQGIDHGTADISQQDQLLPSYKITPTPIVEEEKDVEISSPDVVVTSPNQPSKTQDEGLDLTRVVEEEGHVLEKNARTTIHQRRSHQWRTLTYWMPP